MNNQTKNNSRISTVTIGLAAFLELLFNQVALAQINPINNQPIKDRNGNVIGTLNIDVGPGGLGIGRPSNDPNLFNFGFQVDNKFSKLTDLEKFLGQDHLNWFQKNTSINPAIPGLNPPLIDPPSGGLPIGLDNTWADNRPWYWDEFTPNPVPPGRVVNPDLQLSNNISPNGKSLRYADFPGGPANTTFSFSTFLISDFGNQTYDILGDGFSWTAQTGAQAGSARLTALNGGAMFAQEFAQEIKKEFGWDRAKAPDKSESTKDAPTWNAREVAPGNSLIVVQPTSDGKEIKNSDGSIVQYSKTVPSGNDSVIFEIPGIINGKKVTDATQFTKRRADPGTLYFSVFDENRIMTTESLSNWLLGNNYINSNELFMPDFFPLLDEENVYYGVNWEDLDNNEGKQFVDLFDFRDIFTIDSFGKIPELPMFTFSSTPLDYQPGLGWVGTSLAPGTQLQYNAFHAVSVPVPEPTSTLSLLALGTIGAASTLKSKQNQKKSTEKKTTKVG